MFVRNQVPSLLRDLNPGPLPYHGHHTCSSPYGSSLLCHDSKVGGICSSGTSSEPPPGFEPGTPSLPWKCSATELRRHIQLSVSPTLP